MHTDRPVTRLFNGAAPGKRPGLRVFSMFLLGAGLLCATALAAPPPGAKAQAAPASAGRVTPSSSAPIPAPPATKTWPRDFATNPHTKMALMHGNANGVTCENCHGAGQRARGRRRRRDQDLQSRQGFGQGSRRQVPQLPRGRASRTSMRSPHAKANVSCISCHSIHGSKEETLLKAPQPTLCFQCHSDQKAQFNMPFHHPVNEGTGQVH